MHQHRSSARHRRLDPPRPIGRVARVRVRAGTWTLAVLAVTLIATAGLLGWQLLQSRATEHARRAALAAAQASTPQILSYDYRHLGDDFAQAERDLTGSFKDEYAHTTKAVVTPAAAMYHAVVKASVAAASVVSASPHSVVVLLFVNQTTTSNRLSGPKVDLNRVVMTLVPVGGHWLISAVQAV